MSKIIEISKAGWLKVYDSDNTPSYFRNLNQYEKIRKGEDPTGAPPDQPYYIELVKPGEAAGERITFPSAKDRDEIFSGLAEAL